MKQITITLSEGEWVRLQPACAHYGRSVEHMARIGLQIMTQYDVQYMSQMVELLDVQLLNDLTQERKEGIADVSA